MLIVRCRKRGRLASEEHRVHVLYARQDVIGADWQHSENYAKGDVLRYLKGSAPLGIRAWEYARATSTDREANMVTVKRYSGEELSYDPRRLQGVTVYRDHERRFAQGDRVQMTAPYHELKLANRELGTVEQIGKNGNLTLRMDSGREVAFNERQQSPSGLRLCGDEPQQPVPNRRPRLDSTLTLPRHTARLLNSRMTYVSVSRAQFDVMMYTNDAKALGQELSQDVTKATASHSRSWVKRSNLSLWARGYRKG